MTATATDRPAVLPDAKLLGKGLAGLRIFMA